MRLEGKAAAAQVLLTCCAGKVLVREVKWGSLSTGGLEATALKAEDRFPEHRHPRREMDNLAKTLRAWLQAPLEGCHQ